IPRKSNLGESIKACLDQEGAYVLICPGIDPTRRQELAAKAHLKTYFEKVGYSGVHVDIWSQNKLIGLLDRHPSLSLSVNGRGQLRFQTHKSWSQHAEMTRHFCAGLGQQKAIEDVRAALQRRDAAVHIRLLGDPGIGKTRLALEATGSEELKSSVIYVGSGVA